MVMKDASREAKPPCCVLIDRDIAVGRVQAGYFHGIRLAKATRCGDAAPNLAFDDRAVDVSNATVEPPAHQSEANSTPKRMLFGCCRDRLYVDFLGHPLLGDVVIAHAILRRIVPHRKKSRNPINISRFWRKALHALEANDLADGETMNGHGGLRLSDHF